MWIATIHNNYYSIQFTIRRRRRLTDNQPHKVPHTIYLYVQVWFSGGRSRSTTYIVNKIHAHFYGYSGDLYFWWLPTNKYYWLCYIKYYVLLSSLSMKKTIPSWRRSDLFLDSATKSPTEHRAECRDGSDVVLMFKAANWRILFDSSFFSNVHHEITPDSIYVFGH